MLGYSGATVISINTVVTEDVVVAPGQTITVADGVTLTFSGYFTAGIYPIFAAGSKILFAEGSVVEVYPEWWAGEFGAATSSAIASIVATGGKIVFTKSHDCTTPINATNNHKGMVFEGRGGSGSGDKAPTIAFAHAGVGFDCSNSEHFNFLNCCFKGGPLADTTVPTVVPNVGILFARNAVGSGCGKHSMTNVIFDYYSRFGAACLYTYGAEEMLYINCHFRNKNTVTGGQVVVITCSNLLGITSSFITLATGMQSNTVHKFIGGAVTQEGTNTSNCMYLEGVGEFTVDGGLFFTYLGRSIFYLDSRSQAPLYNASIRNIRQEIKADYVFYANGTNTGNAFAPYNISVTNNHFAQNAAIGHYFIYAANGVVLYEWDIINNTSSGIFNAFDVTYCNIDFNSTLVVRALMSGSTLRSFESATTINQALNSQTYGKAFGAISFTGTITQRSPASKVTLSAGTSTTVSNVPYIKAGAIIVLTAANSSASTLAGIYISAITANTGFTITHNSAAGTEIYNCLIFNCV